jgi:hypothetical protein
VDTYARSTVLYGSWLLPAAFTVQNIVTVTLCDLLGSTIFYADIFLWYSQCVQMAIIFLKKYHSICYHNSLIFVQTEVDLLDNHTISLCLYSPLTAFWCLNQLLWNLVCDQGSWTQLNDMFRKFLQTICVSLSIVARQRISKNVIAKTNIRSIPQ